jgi:hypothetical protein
MFAKVAQLAYWKSEHTQGSCQDAFKFDIERGIFVVSDGVGMAFFSDVWANILVNWYIECPLLSADPFEIEWWLREPQERYLQATPDPSDLSWPASSRAREGSQSTLAAMHIVADEPFSAQAQLLTMGDSCVLIARDSNRWIEAFPIENLEDFTKNPICLPSKKGAFDRGFHRADKYKVRLAPQDTVMLVTDAVALWILSCGAGRYPNQWEAFWQVAENTPNTWVDFIHAQRRKNPGLRDDDSTALIVRFSDVEEQTGKPLPTERDQPICEDSVIQKRISLFEEARAAQNREQMAILFGDGEMLRTHGVAFSDEEKHQARTVANALKEVLDRLRYAYNQKLDIAEYVGPVWKEHETLLHSEPCAETVVQRLREARVDVTLPSVPPTLDQEVPYGKETSASAQQPLPIDPPASPQEAPHEDGKGTSVPTQQPATNSPTSSQGAPSAPMAPVLAEQSDPPTRLPEPTPALAPAEPNPVPPEQLVKNDADERNHRQQQALDKLKRKLAGSFSQIPIMLNVRHKDSFMRKVVELADEAGKLLDQSPDITETDRTYITNARDQVEHK